MKIGLALSGGSLRGAAHIGVLEELLKNNIKPDFIAGTSAGSIVASLYALGYTPQEMEDIFKFIPQKKGKPYYALEMPTKMSLFNLNKKQILPKGLINSNLLMKQFQKFLGKKIFNNTEIPLAVIATDLYTGEIVVFSTLHDLNLDKNNYILESNEQILKAVTASCAIPGVFTPQTLGSRLLVDGGVVNNVPADIVRAMGADIVIAVDLNVSLEREKPLENIIDIIMQSIDIMGHRISTFITNENADLVISPQLPRTKLYDFHRISELVSLGKRETQMQMPHILKVCQKL